MIETNWVRGTDNLFIAGSSENGLSWSNTPQYLVTKPEPATSSSQSATTQTAAPISTSVSTATASTTPASVSVSPPPTTSNATSQHSVSSSAVSTSAVPTPVTSAQPIQIRKQHYQSGTDINVTYYAKGCKPQDVTVKLSSSETDADVSASECQYLHVRIVTPEGQEFSDVVALFDVVKSSSLQHSVTPYKLEISMGKVNAVDWPTLQRTATVAPGTELRSNTFCLSLCLTFTASIPLICSTRQPMNLLPSSTHLQPSIRSMSHQWSKRSKLKRRKRNHKVNRR